MKSSLLIPFFVIGFYSLHAQQKYEKESRLNMENVPSNALNFIDSLSVPGKVRWYLEEGFDGTTVEAKFELKGKDHSIEFDTSGVLQDAEILTKWNTLQKSLKDSIHAHLKECEKYNIRKVQIQYSGSRSAIFSKIKTGISSNDYKVRYELVVKCNQPDNIALFEYLFSDTGQILSTSQIVFKNSSNLEY